MTLWRIKNAEDPNPDTGMTQLLFGEEYLRGFDSEADMTRRPGSQSIRCLAGGNTLSTGWTPLMGTSGI